MSTNRVGPRRMARILLAFTIEVGHLVRGSTSTLHIRRVKLYSDAFVGSPVQMEELSSFTDRNWFLGDMIGNIREVSKEFKTSRSLERIKLL